MLPDKLKYPSDDRWHAGVRIIHQLQAQNHSAYFVGGSVRDILLGLKPGDYDISTSCRPQAILQIFPDSDLIGMRFGVLSVKTEQGYKFQIATFRRDDTHSDGRRPNRIFFSDLMGDSTRRDFTINAIYLNPVDNDLKDPQGGIPDLESKLLRIIGNPVRRLREDHLRILRAVRFASRFNFDIEAESLHAIEKSATLINKLSADRVNDELTRAFTEGDQIFTLELLHKTGILAILWDVFTETGEQLYSAIRKSFESELEPTPAGIWTAFFAPWKDLDIPKDQIEHAMRRINLPRKLKKIII